jgi:uncharacterized membrane protein YedE/YeeE
MVDFLRENKKEYSLFFILSLAGLTIGLLAFVDTGLKGIGLVILGISLGIVFVFFQYGFASGWRNFLVSRDTTSLTQHFILAGLCALVFIPVISSNNSIVGSIAPVNLSLFIGAFMFGIGMQLANGCGSGVLFNFGSGSGRMIIALPFFIIGSVIGTILLPYVLNVFSYGQIEIASNFNIIARTLINAILLFGTSYLFYSYGRKNNQTFKAKVFYGTFIIACLCCCVLFVSGSPWGVTYGFTLWGAKLSLALGIPIDTFTFWNWAGPKRSLENSVLSDVSSLMNFSLIIGAGLAASWSGAFRKNHWPPKRELIAAAIGGLLMGIGARLSFGCNIGAFLAGTASGSLHGWIWFFMAMMGSVIGIRYRKIIGFK